MMAVWLDGCELAMQLGRTVLAVLQGRAVLAVLLGRRNPPLALAQLQSEPQAGLDPVRSGAAAAWGRSALGQSLRDGGVFGVSKWKQSHCGRNEKQIGR